MTTNCAMPHGASYPSVGTVKSSSVVGFPCVAARPTLGQNPNKTMATASARVASQVLAMCRIPEVLAIAVIERIEFRIFIRRLDARICLRIDIAGASHGLFAVLATLANDNVMA